MKDLTVKGINNQHNKTYQFDRCFSIIIWFQSYNKSSCIARVFGPKSEQIHVYRSVVEPLLEEVITHKQGGESNCFSQILCICNNQLTFGY